MTAEPESLGPYRIVRRIGVGGMGVVYEAVHTGLEKRVALKVLPRELAAGRLERFLREARTAAALHHTNIVPVFDVGQVGGVPYYAMQFIDGRPLRADELDRATRPHQPEAPTRTHEQRPDGTRTFAPEPPTQEYGGAGPSADALPTPAAPAADLRRVVVLVLQAAEGLAYAHDRGVVHRDIKPSNLLLDTEGVVWIADFGLAFRTDDPTLTADGAILGTPRYMSPEQACAQKTDCRTDVYSLGVTLYELLTGTAAFPGDTPMSVIRKVLEHTPPWPRALNRRIPRDLETVVLKAMAKRPEDRYANGSEFADDLRRFLNTEPVTARRVTTFGKAWRWSKRNPAVASLLCAVLVVFAVGAGVSAFFAKHAAERETDAKRNEKDAVESAATAKLREQEATDAKNKVLAAEKANRRLAYDARMILASDARRQYDHAALANLLREAYSEASANNPLGWEWNVLFRELHGWSREFDLPAGDVVYFGPSRLIVRDPENLAWHIHDPETMARLATRPFPPAIRAMEEELRRKPPGDPQSGPPRTEERISGDGRRVSHYREGVVRVWDIDTSKELARFAVAEPIDHTFGLSDNGQWLSVCHSTGAGEPVQLRVWDVDAGRAVQDVKASTLIDLRRALTRVANDGSTAVVWGDGANLVYEFAGDFGDRVSIPYGRKPHEPNRSIPPKQAHVAFHPSGRLDQAMALTDRPAVHIYVGLFADDSGEVRGLPGPPTALAYSHDGDRLAVADATGTITVRTHGSSAPQTLRTPGLAFRQVFFRPDGRLVGVAEQRGYEWHLARTPTRRLAVGGVRIDVESVAFSPDGKRVAAAVDWGDHGHRMLVWEVATGRLLLSAECVWQVAARSWSPDGRRLVGVVDATPDPYAHVVAAGGGLAGAVVAPNHSSPDTRTRVVVWDTDTGNRVLEFTRDDEPSLSAAFSSDGRRIVVEDMQRLGIHDAKTGRLLFEDPNYSWLGEAWAFDPAGGRLAIFSEGSKLPTDSSYAVNVWDCETGRRIDSRRVSVKNAIAPRLRFTPDGRWLILLSDDRQSPLTAAYPVTEGGSIGEPIVLREGHGNWTFDGFAAHGRLAAFWGSKATQVFEVGAWREQAALTLPTNCEADSMVFVANSRRLIVSGWRSQTRFVGVWDLDTRQPVLSAVLGSAWHLPESQFASLDGDVLRVLRVTPDKEVLLETLDGTPVPDAVARERLGIK